MKCRILSVLISVLLIVPVFGTSVYADAQIYLNETFDGYPTNSADCASVSFPTGVDGRVVERDGGKAASVKAWGDTGYILAELKNVGDKYVVSADLKIEETFSSGALFEISDGKNAFAFLNINDDGSISLANGKKFSGYGRGEWRNFAVAVNSQRQTYDVYVNGSMVFENVRYNSNITAPVSCAIYVAAPEDTAKKSILNVDNFRLYSGNALMPDSFFQKTSVNPEVFPFAETEEVSSEVKVYLDIDFEGETSVTMQPKENLIEKTVHPDYPEMGNMMHINRNKNSSDAYVDIKLPDTMQNAWKFMYELDLYIAENGGRIFLAEIKDTSNTSHTGVNINGATFTLNSKSAGNIPAGKWVKVNIAYNMTNKTFSSFVNGEVTAQNVPLPNGAFKPSILRFGVGSGSSAHAEFYIDNIKLYAGDKVVLFEKEESEDINAPEKTEKFASVLEKEETTKETIGTMSVFMTDKNAVYFEGDKQKYTDYSLMPYIDGGVFMVPVPIIEKALKVKIDVSGDKVKVGGTALYTVGSTKISNGRFKECEKAPSKRDNTIFLPLLSVCDNTGKYYYVDERNMILTDNAKIPYTNSKSSFEIKEPIDSIYRYMEFERPSGKKVFDDMLRKSGGKSTHPRVLTDRENLDEALRLIDTNPDFRKGFENTIAAANKLFDQKPTEYKLVGVRLLSAAREVLSRVQSLASAYVFTGDEKYAKRCFEEMEYCLSWKDWNTQHYLDNSELCYAMAIGYDYLYDYLTKEQRDFIVKNTYEKSLKYSVAAYGGDYHGSEFRTATGNWGIVCNGGIISACIAFARDGHDEYEEVFEFLIEQAMQGVEYPLMLFYPDGGWAEGPDYWSYVVQYYAAILAPLHFATGNTYDLLSPDGNDVTLNYILYTQSGSGRAFNYADAGDTPITSGNAYIIPLVSGNESYMKIWKEMQDSYGMDLDELSLLWYKPTDKESAPLPLDTYMHSCWVGSMMESWNNREGSWVGIKGGQNHTNHDNLDLGNFIFDALGTRWAAELGKDDYNIEGGYWGLLGYDLYVKRPEGQNCVVINPRSDVAGQYYGGQYLDAYAEIIRQESAPRGAIQVLDLSDAYKFDTTSYKRGFYFGDDRNTLTVKDEISLINPNSEIHWFMHTEADIEIDKNGRGATLSLDGQRLRVEALSNADSYKFEVREVKPFDVSPKREAQLKGSYDKSKFKKLTLFAKGSGNVDIAVKLMPVDTDIDVYEKVKLDKIDSWKLPEGEIPKKLRATAIYADGKLLPDFNSEKSNYIIEVPYGDPIPQITAENIIGTLTVEQSEDIVNPTRIKVTDGNKTVNYTIKYLSTIKTETEFVPGMKAKIGIPDGYKVVYGSADGDIQQPANPPAHVTDGNFSTRWAVEGSGAYVEVDLGEVMDIEGVAVGIYDGKNRQNMFQILISEDGMNYKLLFDGKSTGLSSDDYEAYMTGIKRARFIRYVGFMSSAGSWNSVLELGAIVKK